MLTFCLNGSFIFCVVSVNRFSYFCELFSFNATSEYSRVSENTFSAESITIAVSFQISLAFQNTLFFHMSDRKKQRKKLSSADAKRLNRMRKQLEQLTSKRNAKDSDGSARVIHCSVCHRKKVECKANGSCSRCKAYETFDMEDCPTQWKKGTSPCHV